MWSLGGGGGERTVILSVNHSTCCSLFLQCDDAESNHTLMEEQITDSVIPV